MFAAHLDLRTLVTGTPIKRHSHKPWGICLMRQCKMKFWNPRLKQSDWSDSFPPDKSSHLRYRRGDNESIAYYVHFISLSLNDARHFSMLDMLL